MPFFFLSYGLPISRVYARFFSGDLQLISMDGHGTDAFVFLSKITDSQVKLPYLYGDMPTAPMYRPIPGFAPENSMGNGGGHHGHQPHPANISTHNINGFVSNHQIKHTKNGGGSNGLNGNNGKNGSVHHHSQQVERTVQY